MTSFIQITIESGEVALKNPGRDSSQGGRQECFLQHRYAHWIWEEILCYANQRRVIFPDPVAIMLEEVPLTAASISKWTRKDPILSQALQFVIVGREYCSKAEEPGGNRQVGRGGHVDQLERSGTLSLSACF
ncbi:uncharacterized protein LOC124170640 [Ischnura elegans]|uniref:uncharacterized protein LOC124170640 n=1 Tax=Ischnura elegans TaxID=197161 RepID=UPI001ED872E3|nr:uncharacterized protein LOC124170640 [Ischnura elegans]